MSLKKEDAKAIFQNYLDTAMGEGSLPIFTIYKNPTDFSGRFVLRPHTVRLGVINTSDLFAVSDTLEGLRQLIPDNLFNFGRQERDEPHIVESWI